MKNIVTEKMYVNEYTEIKWHPKSWDHYKRLGYGNHKTNELVKVRTEHLHEGSEIDIQVYCQSCGRTFTTRPFYLSRNSHCLCRPCVHREDISGKKFGSLLAVRFSHASKGKTYWLFSCECGKDVIRHTGNIRKSIHPSCGCNKFKSLLEALFKRKGDKHPMWRKDLTPEEREIRKEHRNGDTEFTEWSYEIKKIGNFTCKACGDRTSGKLVSHHLYNWSAYPDYRYELWNGVCLCSDCHISFHSAYGRKNNTKEQFEQWIKDR